jgi:hypothetical protein
VIRLYLTQCTFYDVEMSLSLFNIQYPCLRGTSHLRG